MYHFFSGVDSGRSYSCGRSWDRTFTALLGASAGSAAPWGSCHQLPSASCFPFSHTTYGELRNHHWVQFVDWTVYILYLSILFRSLLHGEMSGVGGDSAADTLPSKMCLFLVCSLDLSCLETPVGLDYKHEGRKMMS